MPEVLRDALRLRDLSTDTIPGICFDECNNAYLIAQDYGNTPALCASDGAFSFYYGGCKECVEENGQELDSVTSTFATFIDYCTTIGVTSTLAISVPTPTSTVPMSWLTKFETFVPTTVSGMAINGSVSTATVLYISVEITSTLPAYFFHVNASSLIAKVVPTDVFSELAASVASVASVASITGAADPTSLIYSVLEDTSRPPWFQSAVPVTYSTQMATLEAQINDLRADSLGNTTPSSPQSVPTTVSSTSSVINGTTGSSSTSRAWIAGAVIGPVVGIALILFGMYLLRRRRLLKRPTAEESEKTNDKPELHADSLPAPRVYEMDGIQDSVELEVSELPQELPAEEATIKTT